MRVLVCGGRDYNGREKMHEILKHKYESLLGHMTIIQGDARGADRLAKNWALHHKVDCLSFPADWNRYGRSAGPIRNKQMLDEGKPDLVIAFPGGRGTANMIRQARERNVDVMEIENE